MSLAKLKERPIIFSAEMVKAIFDGTKTQTRRVIKPQPLDSYLPDSDFIKALKKIPKTTLRIRDKDNPDFTHIIPKCPYGRVGDRLWVRETWRIESFMDGEPLLFGYKDGKTMEENEYNDTLNYESWYERVCIQSTNEARKAHEQGLVRQREDGCYLWDIGKSPCRWRPSIHMPRWASRILLEITDIRVERLQEISIGDIFEEGCPLIKPSIFQDPENAYQSQSEIQEWFGLLWDSLNAKYGWETNPWVWVISFRENK